MRYWDGSSAVRQRLHALARASAGIVLFQEFIPYHLDDWLAAQLAAGQDAAVAACAMVESCLPADAAFMNGHGLMHFDAHFGDILTDGRRLYIADFGLATSPRFDLSAQEIGFLDRNGTHDMGYALMRPVNWLVTNVCGVATPREGGPVQRNECIRACAAGLRGHGCQGRAGAVVGAGWGAPTRHPRPSSSSSSRQVSGRTGWSCGRSPRTTRRRGNRTCGSR